ncbi:MAG TPA: hypothetical protein VIM70_13285 [Clostridium sp.]|uniref:hypothetical protein n=1 Tax=Clostridium sp. TaxID=1506 RepID=UPI002F9281B6
MLYDVERISQLTKMSKVTIYKQLKLKEIKACIVRKQGKSFVDEVGFNLIKESLNLNDELNNDEIATDKISDTIEDESSSVKDTEDLIKSKNELINSLTEQVVFLKQQLREKDMQIDKLHVIVENSQVLLKAKPQQDVLQLEEHFQNLDNKFIEIKDKMQNKDQDHIGLFRRIFKK